MSKWIPTSGFYPKGFLLGSISSGVKKESKPDLTLVLSESPCTAAGVFTKNTFAAAPVQVCRSLLQDPNQAVHALLVNSGCANACTGEQGLKDAMMLSKLAHPSTPALVM